jgi:hypothetical protein
MKVGLWFSILGLMVLTAVCAYQAAVIQHLEFVIALLGRSNLH